jgi:hypothetical protein
MSQRNERILWVSILLIFSFLCIWFRFPDYFRTPNSKVIEPWGDGYKTYMAFIYHVKYDSTYSHLQAMNYPYGEHVIPGDAQPALSNIVKFISQNIIDISDYYRGIIHFSMLSSLLLCSLFLYLIFRKLDVAPWYAIPVAIALTFMAPQTERIAAHYGLAYPALLPMILYFLLRLEERWQWKYSVFIGLTVWFFSAIHFYYFAILVFTISGYFFFSLMQKRDWQNWLRYALHYGIQVIIPLIFFIFWIFMNDPVTDRPDKPWGYFAHRARWEGVFLSMKQPMYQWIHEHWIKIREVNSESHIYVGLVAFVASIIFAFRLLRHLFRKPPFHFESEHRTWLNASFYMAVAILLFSFGLPFTIKGLEKLLDYTGPLQQFRSIGRFAWVFYYVINIIVFAGLYHWGMHDARWRTALMGFAVAVLVYESGTFTKSLDLRLDEIEEDAPGKSYNQIPNLNDYQGILPIPYYNIGSDNLWWRQSGFMGQKAATLVMQTGLPTTAAMLTRTSVSQTFNQVQLIVEPYRRPKILDDFPSDKPLLLAFDSIRVKEYPGKYTQFPAGLPLVYERGELRLYKLPLSSFETYIEQRKQQIINDLDSLKLQSFDMFLTTGNVKDFAYQSWDDKNIQQRYLGKGGFESRAKDRTILFDNNIPAQQPGGYIISSWMLMNKDLYPRTKFDIVEYNPADGSEVQHMTWEVKDLIQTIDNNGWVLIELGLDLHNPQNKLRLTVFNEELGKALLFFDELLIRPFGTHLYRKTEDMIWYDNRWWKLK